MAHPINCCCGKKVAAKHKYNHHLDKHNSSSLFPSNFEGCEACVIEPNIVVRFAHACAWRNLNNRGINLLSSPLTRQHQVRDYGTCTETYQMRTFSRLTRSRSAMISTDNLCTLATRMKGSA